MLPVTGPDLTPSAQTPQAGKVTIELDERDVVRLLELLTEKIGYIPSKLRPGNPWLRICRQVSASFSSKALRQRHSRENEAWTDTTSS